MEPPRPRLIHARKALYKHGNHFLPSFPPITQYKWEGGYFKCAQKSIGRKDRCLWEQTQECAIASALSSDQIYCLVGMCIYNIGKKSCCFVHVAWLAARSFFMKIQHLIFQASINFICIHKSWESYIIHLTNKESSFP